MSTQQKRSFPPPPGWEARRVDGEDDLMQHWERPILRLSAKVFYPENLGWDREDVAQDLRLTLQAAIRAYAWEYGGLAPHPFCNTVLQRRVKNLVRDTRAGYRRSEQERPTPEQREIDVPDEFEPMDDALIGADREAVSRALVYMLRRRLTVAQFAILHLSYVEGMAPKDIARALDLESPVVSKRLATAKRRAGEFLRTLGIDTWDGVGDVQVEELHHESID